MYIRYLKNTLEIIEMSMSPIISDITTTVVEVPFFNFEQLISCCDKYLYKYENNKIVEAYTELEKKKMKKITELRTECNTWILSGFFSNAKDNITKEYDFDDEDQINMTGIMSQIATAGPDHLIYWKAKGELIASAWTPIEFTQLFDDAANTKLYKMMQYHIKRQDAYDANNINQLESITLK